MGIREEWRRWSLMAGVLMMLAVGMLVAVPFLGRAMWDNVQSGRALAAADHCAGGACLVELDGSLDGPYPKRRTVNKDWTLRGDDGTFHDFEAPPHLSGPLGATSTHVTGLLYRGDVVAVVSGDGTTLRTLEGGTRPAVFTGTWCVLLLSGAPLLAVGALLKRRAWGGWWSREGPAFEPIPQHPAAWMGLVVVVLAVMAGAAMLMGAPWPWSVGGAGLFSAVFAVLLARGLRARASR